MRRHTQTGDVIESAFASVPGDNWILPLLSLMAEA